MGLFVKHVQGLYLEGAHYHSGFGKLVWESEWQKTWCLCGRNKVLCIDIYLAGNYKIHSHLACLDRDIVTSNLSLYDRSHCRAIHCCIKYKNKMKGKDVLIRIQLINL